MALREGGERKRRALFPRLMRRATGGAVAGCNFEPLPFIRRRDVCLVVAILLPE